jgi:5-methylcytosine-specific restriction endonuclease McrA
VNVASGGTDDPENLRAACRPCNRAKAQAEAAAARRARSAGGRHPTERHPGLL